jgi:hypothetical protein
MKRNLCSAFGGVTMACIATAPVYGADIVNGWSTSGSITKLFSANSYTYFKMSSTSSGCGHVDLWALPTLETAASKAKLSLLLAAYAMGKTVNLRCENSQITDFEILD